jgi:hypothetical protein
VTHPSESMGPGAMPEPRRDRDGRHRGGRGAPVRPTHNNDERPDTEGDAASFMAWLDLVEQR